MAAVILVENDRIVDVVEVPEDAEVDSLMLLYASWHPLNLEHHYISPGLIDCNVQLNGSWDGFSSVTRAAISGGVTFLVVEPSLYRLESDNSDLLYCDVGKVALVGFSSLEDVGKEVKSGAFAVKAYMFPPSAYVNGVAQQLENVLEIAQTEQVPLFLDVSYPSPRMLYMASPCRLLPLEERAKQVKFSDDQFFAGAFPEEIDPESPMSSSSESSEDGSGESPGLFSVSEMTSPVTKIGVSDGARTSIGYGIQHGTKKIPTCKSFKIGKSKPREFHLLRTPTMSNLNDRRRSLQVRNIYEDLQKRIEASQGNIQNLSQVELMGYGNAGATEFNARRRRSSSISTESPIPELITSPHFPNVVEFSVGNPEVKPPIRSMRDRLKRPLGLEIGKGTPRQDEKDRKYIYHLANHPDHWETNGIAVAWKRIKVRNKVDARLSRTFLQLVIRKFLLQAFKSKTDEFPSDNHD